MWSVQDMFYGEAEPVWIVKPEKKEKDDDKNKNASGGGQSSAAKQSEYSILNIIPDYPYYYQAYVAPVKKDEQKKKETQVVMKVPICCGECEESVDVAFNGMIGVKSVMCDSRKEKVTVVVTTAAPADVLLKCRSVFPQSRMWTSDD